MTSQGRAFFRSLTLWVTTTSGPFSKRSIRRPATTLRRVLIRDQADRDSIASRLMRYRDQTGQDWADIVDFLTMYPEARRRVARVLGEINAADE
jgi:hypothetical protein